jgi:chemotaxis protein MotB
MNAETLLEELEHEVTAWPAFVDLLTATTLLFTTLVAVFIFVANRAIATGNAERTEREALREALERAGTGSASGRLYSVEDDGQFIRITLQAEATFPTREWSWSALKPQGKGALMEIARIMQRDSIRALYRQVRILGHTDQVPYGRASDFTNWELSAARAAVVARYLVSEGGIDPCVISASGLGPYFPKSIRKSEHLRLSYVDRMSMNRRIEIEVVPAKSRDEREGDPCWAAGDTPPAGKRPATPSRAAGAATFVPAVPSVAKGESAPSDTSSVQ